MYKKLIIPIIFIMFIVCGCTEQSNNLINSDVIKADTNIQSECSTALPVVPLQDKTVKICAVGDNLIHSSIYRQAKSRSTDGTYDFDYAYKNVESLINGDINIINQETPICNDIYPPSSYPLFNSPTQLGDKMISLGFNAFNLANNHCLDQGVNGSCATLDYFNSRNTVCFGMYRNDDDMENIRLIKKNDITFSFLGFTEHTNGLSVPGDSTLRIVYTGNEEEMKRQITKARNISDVVVVSVHWGVENSHIINDNQRDLAQKFSDWGADIVIGTHPHVLQAIEEITGNGGNKTLVAYSLGNFISAQDVNNRLIGGLLSFIIRKNENTGKITYEDVSFCPIITHYDRAFSNIRLYPLSQYSDELAKSHGVNVKSPFNMDFINKTISNNIEDKYIKIQ